MKTGHLDEPEGCSTFRVYAPERGAVRVVLPDIDQAIDLVRDELGYWSGTRGRLEEGTRYWIEVDGERRPDVASRRQPDGVTLRRRSPGRAAHGRRAGAAWLSPMQ